MLTVGIMLFIVVFLGYVLLIPDKLGKKNGFFDLDTTTTMRGFWCLVIMLVHVPASRQNFIQDLIGSFAYIGVTFFFMSSSYGLMVAVKRSPTTALQGFWKWRLPKLLIPMLIVNLLTMLADEIFGSSSIWTLFSITGFVRQLLMFYFVFWLVFRIPMSGFSLRHRELILCLSVIVISVLIYFTDGVGVFSWPTESFGFLYGILLSEFHDSFARKASSKWHLKCVIGFIISLVLGALYLNTKQIVFLGDYVIRILLGLCILVFMLCVNTRYPIGNAIGRFLGDISYEIYLIHGLVFGCVGFLLGELNSGLYIMISILITILLSVATHRVGVLILRPRKKAK